MRAGAVGHAKLGETGEKAFYALRQSLKGAHFGAGAKPNTGAEGCTLETQAEVAFGCSGCLACCVTGGFAGVAGCAGRFGRSTLTA